MKTVDGILLFATAIDIGLIAAMVEPWIRREWDALAISFGTWKILRRRRTF